MERSGTGGVRAKRAGSRGSGDGERGESRSVRQHDLIARTFRISRPSHRRLFSPVPPSLLAQLRASLRSASPGSAALHRGRRWRDWRVISLWSPPSLRPGEVADALARRTSRYNCDSNRSRMEDRLPLLARGTLVQELLKRLPVPCPPTSSLFWRRFGGKPAAIGRRTIEPVTRLKIIGPIQQWTGIHQACRDFA